MASTSKAFKKCVDLCPRYLTPDDTHDCCVFVWAKSTHAMSLRGQSACTVSYKKAPFSSVPLFEERGTAVCFPRFGTAAEARRRLKSRGSQLDMADELEKDRPFSRASAENESELLDCDDVIFLTSSDSAVSALLGYAQEEQEMFEGEEVETEPSQSSCTAYDEFLEVMDHKNKSFWP